MKETELMIDRSRHLVYSKAAKKTVLDHLGEAYPDRADALWEKTQHLYEDFLKTQPPIGGKSNFQAGSVYDCILLFAFYEAAGQETGEYPSFDTMVKLNNALFIPQMTPPFFYNLNYGWALSAANGIFSHLAKNGKKHAEEWIGNYHMEVQPFDKKVGVRYRFYTCPIADFAKAHGYTHLMPAFCNPDYPLLRKLRAGLIRRSTCANGDYCDYWIVGDESPVLEEYPVKTDEAGYLYNECPPWEELGKDE